MGGSINPPTAENTAFGGQYVHQDGRAVYRYAVTNMCEASQNVLNSCGLDASQIDYLLPHQANLRIIESVTEHLGLPKEKVLVNIERYGNTTDGTLPLLLWNFEKTLKKGDKLLLTTFGGGFTWGSMYLTWDY